MIFHSPLHRQFFTFLTRVPRLILLGTFFLTFSCIILFQLYKFQIEDGSLNAAKEVGQRSEINEVEQPRGNIFIQDEAGKERVLVATNKETPHVFAVPAQIENPTIILGALAQLIEIDDDKQSVLLAQLSNRDSWYVRIADRLSEEDARKVQEAELQGVYIRNDNVRFYPRNSRASQVIGYLGDSKDQGMVGRYGIEQYFNSILAGKSGFVEALPFLGIEGTQVGFPGADVYLTIDNAVQYHIEEKLRQVVESTQAKSGSAVFMDPKTGAIIAMAHYPSFNPNNYSEYISDDQEDRYAIFKNNTISSAFEPGSIFKPITIASALDSGAITPITTYEDHGFVIVDGHKLSNVGGVGRGKQTMTQVLEKSLNTGTVFAMGRMGKDTFVDYLEKFQLQEETGIDLVGETVGNFHGIRQGAPDVNFATATFGQGISMTLLRILTAISALANDGVMMQPYIVEKIIDHEGNETITEPQETGRPISSFTATRITDMLVKTAENGYGKRIMIPGRSIAAKTGTAQIARENGQGYYRDKVIHSFVGYAPAYNPKFVGIIRLDEPQTIEYATDSLSPVFREISKYLFQYYAIPPDK